MMKRRNLGMTSVQSYAWHCRCICRCAELKGTERGDVCNCGMYKPAQRSEPLPNKSLTCPLFPIQARVYKSLAVRPPP
eukprot:4918093-Pyramimonas_sp.AAC.1